MSTVATLIAVALAVVLWSATGAQARPRALTPGVRAAAPTAQELSQALGQATGLSPSQVTPENVCPPAQPGYARCSGVALHLRSNGSLVRPHHAAHASLGRVRTGSRSGSGSPATGSSATPPQADTPAYLEQAYDLAYLSQTAGAGDTVAIIDADYDPTAATDLVNYRTTFGLTGCPTTTACQDWAAQNLQWVNENGATSPLPTAQDKGWEQETSLDLDAVSAICPNCKILLVEANSANSTDLDAAMQTAATMGANQISDSWTISSSHIPSGTYTFPGVATVAATGDTGYARTADNYPAAFPNVTAAGGTTLSPASGANARGFGESAWSLSEGQGGGSGCDLHFTRPAYQPNAGCNGRAYADLSADANPNTGLITYDSGNGGWALVGGTSLASPLIAAYYAVTGVSATSPQWSYSDSGLLNDVVTGSTGTCTNNILYICNAGVGYDGPTGVGSISGEVTTGAPGIGGPSIVSGSSNTYTQSTQSHAATITGGIYRNGVDTKWWIQYGTSTSYGSQTTQVDVGSGTAPVSVTGYLSQLSPGTTYHYRLVAQNSLGTITGYDYTLTTPQATPGAPTAAFTASPTGPTPGSSVSFNASGSSAGSTSISQYSWNFGDGTPTENDSSPTTTHSYTNRGPYTATLTVTNSNGSDTTTQTVRIDNPPTAAFTPSATLTTPGSAVNFDGTASAPGNGGTITDYSWNFGDGTSVDTGTTPTTSHAYTSPGNHTATLTVTDDLNVSNTVSVQITVDQPTASFSVSPPMPTPGSSASFDASGSSDPESTITDYSWNFGDGTPGSPDTFDSGTTPATSHTYTTRGAYTVTLTVTNSNGQTATQTQTLYVEQPPSASFTATPTPTAPNTQVTFDGSTSAPGSGGTITDYSWNFGDGSPVDDTGTTPADSHTYTLPGVYTAMLTVTDDLGVAKSTTQQVVVDQPDASFTASPPTPAPGALASFDATASSDPAGMITDYSWNFGDGVTEDTGTTPTTSHQFSSRNTYHVTLTITNNYGQSSTSTDNITVDNPPVAAFTDSPAPSTSGSPVAFNGTGSSSSGGTINSYSWNFGDGATATGPTPGHTYLVPGIYTVTLAVTDDLGLTNSVSHQMTVDAPPVASFALAPNPASPGAPVAFNGSSSSDSAGTITGYSWNFGDGTAGSGVGPSHAYASPGTYIVTLTVTNDVGESGSSAQSVTVYGSPAASFAEAPSPVTVGSAVSFAGGTSADPGGSITGYSWNFGDGATATGVNASHAYTQPGSYTVTLTVSGSGGKTASTTHTVTVNPQPLTGRVAAPKQKLTTVLKRGLQLNVSVSQSSRATFQVTIPGAVKHSSKASSGHQTAITLMTVRGRTVRPGTHQITLKLSPSAARALPGRGPVVLTVRVTVTDAYRRTLTRSVKVSVQR